MLKNRTNAFLKRLLILESDTLIKLLLSVEDITEGFYCDHKIFRQVTKNEEPLLFMKLKYTKQSKFFQFLKHVKKSKAYLTDYPYDFYGSHVVVFKINERFHKSYFHFLKGEYSKMYTPEEIKLLKFPKMKGNEKSIIYAILTKDPYAYNFLKEMLKVRFKVNVAPPLEDVKEFDLPPSKEDFL